MLLFLTITKETQGQLTQVITHNVKSLLKSYTSEVNSKPVWVKWKIRYTEYCRRQNLKEKENKKGHFEV